MIYADLDYLLEKMHSYQNNFEISYTEKKTKHMPSGYPILQVVRLTQQKTNLIVTKVKTVWKGFVKTYVSIQQE